MSSSSLPGFAPQKITLRNSKKVTLRSVTPNDKEKCLGLRLAVYGASFQSEVWDWKYSERCPYPHDVLVVEAEEEVVAIQAMLVFPFMIGKRRVHALSLLDLMVHPAWRKQGLFAHLIKRIERELLNRFAFFYSFPNRRSFPGFIRRFGWLIPFHPTLMVRLALPKRVKKIPVETPHPSRPRVHLFKDQTYLDWRYSRPDMEYQRLSDRSVVAFQEHWKIKTAFAAEFSPQEGEESSSLLKAMEQAAAAAPLVFLTNPTSPTFGLLKRNHFSTRINLLRRFHLVVKMAPRHKELLQDLADWDLSFGDFDGI
ncbi:hypothetical protein CEE36_07355 [candidate division TA06 bacterium B3_TA06]|uniref:N-acetyltransferase domain-containing protein n=1 Tax=candidate division TA06 bacterium B3_TA06 TaxID=2012487 RepID=A0A532V499_UNCT6|nr:MAG: hypothetical protein CEE36_07355 [candidate division TA06 bacterium B3_TA06]